MRRYRGMGGCVGWCWCIGWGGCRHAAGRERASDNQGIGLGSNGHVKGTHAYLVFADGRVVNDDAFHIVQAVASGDVVTVVGSAARAGDNQV